jgi:hypothetical protein
MVEVSRLGAARSMIFRHKIQQNTDRIARTPVKLRFAGISCARYLPSLSST